jgi:hypothetical protein
MTFTTIKSALKATRKFHKAYGAKGSKYICRAERNGYVVECHQVGCDGFYFATLV